MNAALNSIKCRERTVETNPQLLVHRICCVIESKEDLEEFLKFELTQQPSSISNQGLLRKNNNSDLAKIII